MYSFVVYLYVSHSGSITSVGEERDNLSAVVFNYVVSVRRGFLFLLVLGMGYVILLWHSLSLPYTYLLHLCNQEEADSRIFLYVADVVNEGLQEVKTGLLIQMLFWQLPLSDNCLFKSYGFHLAQEGSSNTLPLLLYAMV